MATQTDPPEAEKDRLRECFFEAGEVELIYTVLGLHKPIESNQQRKLFECAQIQSVGLTTAFARFAPEPFDEAIVRWDEDGKPDFSLIEGGRDG